MSNGVGKTYLDDSAPDFRTHFADVLFDIFRSYSENLKAGLPHVFVAFVVVLTCLTGVVNDAVDLDDELQFFAAKVGEVRS